MRESIRMSPAQIGKPGEGSPGPPPVRAGEAHRPCDREGGSGKRQKEKEKEGKKRKTGKGRTGKRGRDREKKEGENRIAAGDTHTSPPPRRVSSPHTGYPAKPSAPPLPSRSSPLSPQLTRRPSPLPPGPWPPPAHERRPAPP